MSIWDNTYVGTIWDKWRKGEYAEKSYPGIQDYGDGVNFQRHTTEATGKKKKTTKKGYYEKEQEKLESEVGTVNVGPGKSINIDYNKKTNEMMGDPYMKPGWAHQTNTQTGAKSTADAYYANEIGLHKNYKKSEFTDKDGESISKVSGMDWNAVKKHWKDKGGMDALMANPAFTLGLALMQSSAKGKRIDENILDNFVKATNISAEYKDRVKAKGGIYEATADQVASVKATLNTMGTSAPNWLEAAIKPGNQGAQYEAAVEKIAIEMQKRLETEREKNPGKKITFDDDFRRKVIEDLIRKKQIKVKGGFLWFDATLESGDFSKLKARAEGGPVEAGQPYLVGEKGPEVIIPNSDGNVLANDDSQIFAMLLASNPQLQNVSRQRAERILRSRFPEYFEV